MPLVRRNPWWITRGNTVATEELPTYKFSMKVAMPFIGIGCAARAFLEAGWPFEVTNGYDTDKKLVALLSGGLLPPPHHVKCAEVGNPRTEIAVSQGGVFTAPCQDFSLLFDGKGLTGSRGKLFLKQLQMIKKLSLDDEEPLQWATMGGFGFPVRLLVLVPVRVSVHQFGSRCIWCEREVRSPRRCWRS